MDAISIQELYKKFGSHQVLTGMNLRIPEGSIFGLIGENGAGKTTTMKIILGLMKADSGQVKIFDEEIGMGKKWIGYLPDVPSFYSYMNASEYMKLCGQIAGMNNKDIKSRSDQLLNMVGIPNVKTRIGGYSRGMKQRLGIAQALLSEPRLLICDEPTSALDPIGRKEIIDIISSLRGKTTVIFSTHILSDVERICDEIAVLNKGRIVLEGPIEQLRASHGNDKIDVEFASSDDAHCLIEALKEVGILGNCQGESVAITHGNIEETGRRVIRIIADKGLMPMKIQVAEPTLESLFLEVVK